LGVNRFPPKRKAKRRFWAKQSAAGAFPQNFASFSVVFGAKSKKNHPKPARASASHTPRFYFG
jgi:hypothetical protein